MKKKIGLVWLKDDFRIIKNFALIEATKKHDQVKFFFLYKKQKYKEQEAQNWWVSKSLKQFKEKLSNYNINLEIIKTESYKSFFDKIFNKKNYSIYWNKTYEPDYIKFDEYLSKKFESNGVEFNISKGNILNEYIKLKNQMELRLEFLLLFGEMQKNFIWKRFQKKKRKYQNVFQKHLFLVVQLMQMKSFQKKTGLKNLINIGFRARKMH